MKLGNYFLSIAASALFAVGCATTERQYDMRAGLPDLGRYVQGKVKGSVIMDFDENGDGIPESKIVQISSDTGEEARLRFIFREGRLLPYPTEAAHFSPQIPCGNVVARIKTESRDNEPDGVSDVVVKGYEFKFNLPLDVGGR